MDDKLLKKMERIESILDADYKKDGTVDAVLASLKKAIEQLTGLREFDVYISKLMTIDALFLNEDRHTHNIAVLLDDCDQFHYCPIFDNGASLLSDTIQDYPMEEKIQDLVKRVKAKTFHDDFDEQLDTVEELYGRQIRFHFDRAIVEKIIAEEQNYSNDVKERVYDLISRQMRKYQYLFE